MRARELTIEAFYGKRGIKHGIATAILSGNLGATVTLTYSGIDVAAALCRPAAAAQVTRDHFVEWCESYLHVVGAPDDLTGLDWYAARCAVLHSYSAESALSRRGEARPISYRGGGGAPPWVAAIDEQFADGRAMVMIQVEALVDAFFAGLDACLPDLYATPERARVTDARLPKLLAFIPYREVVEAVEQT